MSFYLAGYVNDFVLVLCHNFNLLLCHNQAEKQLSSDWILMRAGNMGVPTLSEWLNDVLPPGSRVGIDPVRPIYDVIDFS